MTEEEELQSQRAIREREHEARKANRERILSQYGNDDFNDGDMLRYYKMFVKDGRLYTYGAVKSLGVWYITGVEGQHTWTDLLSFFEDENLLDARFILIAASYESVFEEASEDDE